jgi:protoporphyrinogen oxidase
LQLSRIVSSGRAAESEDFMTQEENVKKLLELIQQNPEVEVVPMVDSEVIEGDEFSSWMGSWDGVSLDEYYCTDEKIYFRSTGEDTLVDIEYDAFFGTDISDEEAMKLAKEKVNSYEWTKCICVEIGPA